MLEGSSLTTSRDLGLTSEVIFDKQNLTKHTPINVYFPGSPEDSRHDLVTGVRGAIEQGGVSFEQQDGGPFEQGGGPFERAEASSGGVFEDWRQRGEDGKSRDSVENQKTTTASPTFPHAIPEDVQFFEPSLVSSSYFFYQCPHWYTHTHYPDISRNNVEDSHKAKKI